MVFTNKNNSATVPQDAELPTLETGKGEVINVSYESSDSGSSSSSVHDTQEPNATANPTSIDSNIDGIRNAAEFKKAQTIALDITLPHTGIFVLRASTLKVEMTTDFGFGNKLVRGKLIHIIDGKTYIPLAHFLIDY